MVTRRFLLSGVFLAAALLAPALASPASAGPSTAPAPVYDLRVTGDGLGTPLDIDSLGHPNEYYELNSEITFLASGNGITPSPKTDQLGPKYTVVVLVNAVPRLQYDLYPLASGGPRVFRPATQPDKHKTTAAWFYGRLTLPTTLREVGVPLVGGPTYGAGGIGGGVPATSSKAPTQDVNAMMGEWRNIVALNGGLAILLGIGLFGIAYLMRRRI